MKKKTQPKVAKPPMPAPVPGPATTGAAPAQPGTKR